MAHLFAGLVVGLVLHSIIHNKNSIFFCMMGSVLPDLVRVLVEFLFTGPVVKSVKFYSQTLALFVIFLTTGLCILAYYRSSSFLGVAAGIYIHKIVDTFANPDWQIPLLGPVFTRLYHGPLRTTILMEIASVTEWVFFIVIAGILFWVFTGNDVMEPGKASDQSKELVNGIFGIVVIIFILLFSSAYIL